MKAQTLESYGLGLEFHFLLSAWSWATLLNSLSLFPHQQNGDKNTLLETSVLYWMKFTQGNLRKKEIHLEGCFMNPRDRKCGRPHQQVNQELKHHWAPMWLLSESISLKRPSGLFLHHWSFSLRPCKWIQHDFSIRIFISFSCQQRPIWFIYIQLQVPIDLSLIGTVYLTSGVHLFSTRQSTGGSGSCHSKVIPFLECDDNIGVRRK